MREDVGRQIGLSARKVQVCSDHGPIYPYCQYANVSCRSGSKLVFFWTLIAAVSFQTVANPASRISGKRRDVHKVNLLP